MPKPTLSNLPDETIVAIIVQLDLKTMMRCTQVCPSQISINAID